MNHNLQGYLIMECLDSEVTLCELDLTGEYETIVLTPWCAGRCFEASVTDDGKKIVYLQFSEFGNDTIWALTLGEQYPQLLVEDEWPKMFPVWSPSGHQIAYRVLHAPYIPPVRPAGATPMLTTVPRIVSVSYRYTSLYVFDLVEGYDVQVTPDEIKVRDHVWSPNGNSLAVSGHLEDINQDGKIDQDDPAWLYTISLPDYTIECVDAAKEIEDSRLEPSWSADGRYLAYLGNRDELVVLDAMTYEEITRFEIDPGSKAYHWAPDSARIAYVGTSSWPDSVHLFVDLFIFDLETSTHIRLTNTSTYTIYGVYERNGVQLDHPLWSPDGKQIAIMWRTGDQEYLVVSKADGSQLTKVTKLEHYYRLVAWVKKEN